QPRGQDAAPVGLEPIQIEPVDVAGLEHLALEPLQPLAGDFALTQPGAAEALPHSTDGPRGSYCLLPAETVDSLLDRHEFQPRCGVGLPAGTLGDLAVGKEPAGEGHAADRQTFTQDGFETFADDELGAAAAGIDDQPLALIIGQGVGHAQIDESRLLPPGNHIYPVAEDILDLTDEDRTIACHPQGIGSHDAHSARGQPVDQLGKAPQAVQPALHGLLGQVVVLIQTAGQLHLLAQPLQNPDLSMIHPGQHHMEAVGAQIYGRHQWHIRLFYLRHALVPCSASGNSTHLTRRVSAPCDKLGSSPIPVARFTVARGDAIIRAIRDREPFLEILMSDLIVHVTDSSFESEVLKADGPVLVDYWAEWCGPCKMIAPVLDDIARDYQGKLKICKLNIDENTDTPPKYGVRGIPTLMLFKDGNVEATKVGALSKSQLAAFLDSNI